MVLGDPSCLQIDPRWSLDVRWVLLDAAKIQFEFRQIKSEHLEIYKFVKMRA
jgi:hypothetical protein